MKSRFQATRLAFENINQYLTNIAVKRKIWEVYVSSVIEWFLPVIGYHRRDNLASINVIESFQNSTLSTALNVSKFIGRRKMNSIAVTKPVVFKLRAMGRRLKRYTARTSAEIETTQADTEVGVTLRNGKRAKPGKWKNAERKDFVDQILILNDEFTKYPENYLKKFDKNNKNRPRFDTTIAKTRIAHESQILNNRMEFDDQHLALLYT